MIVAVSGDHAATIQRDEDQRRDVRYRRVYGMLRRYGHSPLQALRVVVDAHRGEHFAMWWIRCIRSAEMGV